MTEKEHRVKRCQLGVEEQRNKVKEATLKLQSESARLQLELEREKIKLDQEISWLELAKSDLERGYDS